MIEKIKATLGSRMARNSGWMFVGQLSRVALQAAYFFLIARTLGVTEYGAFVAITSLVMIVSPFSGLGAGNIIIMKVARDPRHFAEAWGKALFLGFTTGAVLAIIIIQIASIALPKGIGRETVMLVAVSDLLGPRIADVAAMAFGAFEKFRWNAILQIASTGFRTIAAGIMVLAIKHPTTSVWVWFYAISSVIMSVFALSAVTVQLGWPQFRIRDLWPDVKEGVFFSLSMSAQTVYNDIDKTMLSRLSTLNATGIYGAAYRIVDVSCAPLRAMTSAAYPSFFREGQKGVGAAYALAKKILHKATYIALSASVGMFLLAPLLPRVLGAGYGQTVDALRWLALLPVLKCFHFFWGDALSGAGHQRIRAAMQIGVAVFNIAINFWIIPAYSWRGAAWSSLASDGLLAVLMFACIVVLQRPNMDGVRKQPEFAGE